MGASYHPVLQRKRISMLDYLDWHIRVILDGKLTVVIYYPQRPLIYHVMPLL